MNVGTITSKGIIDTSQFKVGINDMKKLGDKVSKDIGRSFQRMGRNMRQVGKGMTAGITLPLVGAGAMAVKTAADYERLRTSMDALNGSVEEGARNFQRLQRFSARTPFQLQDLAQAQNMLQGFGMAADDAFDSLSMIGDIAAITGGEIEGIGIAFGQASAEGRVMTRDIRQFINQGVPMVKMLAETMGVAQSEIFDLASQGEISFEILQQAFRDATTEGGVFADGMEQQSKTISGLFSTLKDNVSIALGELGDTIVDTFALREAIPNLIQNIQIGIKWFQGLEDNVRRNMIGITAGIAAIGPTLIGVGFAVTALGTVIAALTSPVTLVIGTVAGLSAAIMYTADNWDVLKERMSDTGWWRNMIIGMIQFFNDQFLYRIWDGMNAIFRLIGGQTLANPFSAVSDGLESLKTETAEYEHEFGGFRDSVLNAFEAMTGVDFGEMFTMPEIEQPEMPDGNIEDQAEGMSDRLKEVFSLNDEWFAMSDGIKAFGDSMEESDEKSTRFIQTQEFLTDIANRFTDSFGRGMANVVVQGERLVDTLKNIGKLLASSVIQQGLQILLSGGLSGTGFFGQGGGVLGSVFGGLFHSGGMISGSGEKMIRAKGGEFVLTPQQMNALGQTGGQRDIDYNAIGKSFEKALDRKLNKLGEREIYAMSQRGRFA